MVRLAIYACFWFLSISTAYSAQRDPAINADVVTFSEIPFATVQADHIWRQLSIPVCWEHVDNDWAAMQAKVKRAVEETWQKYSAVQFVGWGPCYSDSTGIRILISDNRPHTKALGNLLNSMPNGMELNFSLTVYEERCAALEDFCIRALSVHEFGHALGFAHEQNREDADIPVECETEFEDSSLAGDWNLTDYDSSSIMNYCNKKWLNKGFLSDRDASAVRYLYGAHKR